MTPISASARFIILAIEPNNAPHFNCIKPGKSVFSCRQTIHLYSAIVLARCGKLFVVVLLVLTTGLHWTALQTVAWTTMLAANLRSHSVFEAVSDTFDGRHLCPLCKAIAAAKKSEKKSEALATTLKMEFPPATEKYVLISPKAATAFSWADLSATPLFSEPPVPPPRGFFV